MMMSDYPQFEIKQYGSSIRILIYTDENKLINSNLESLFDAILQSISSKYLRFQVTREMLATLESDIIQHLRWFLLIGLLYKDPQDNWQYDLAEVNKFLVKDKNGQSSSTSCTEELCWPRKEILG